MDIKWHELGTERAEAAHGSEVRLLGFPVAPASVRHSAQFLLAAEPGCCAGCAPRHALATVAVTAAAPVPVRTGALSLTGTWEVAADPSATPRYRLLDARLAAPPGWAGVTRRGVMAAAGPLICLAAADCTVAASTARAAVSDAATVDLHSHAGGVASVARIRSGMGFGIVADPMRRGGMAVICLAIVSDGPTHRVAPDGRIHPYRDPKPGELYEYGQLAFRRATEFARAEHLTPIRAAADLIAARADRPSFIMAAEGADFLEGQVDRVDEAQDRWALRHLQLTHYRVNELGDIQTESPVHGGLTGIGAAVIRRCNQRGIVVDVAHGTFDLVKQAAAVTSKPLVLSHTSLSRRPGPFSRLISADHARAVAGTGGVIGIWPPVSVFPDVAAMAVGMARMVDAVGIDHVGLGTDMRGLVGPSVLPDYDRLPDLTAALLSAGFHSDEVGKLLGGNYARVFASCMA